MVGANESFVGGAARLARQEVIHVIKAGGLAGIFSRNKEQPQIGGQDLFDTFHEYIINLRVFGSRVASVS